MITITFACDGCDAKVTAESGSPLRKGAFRDVRPGKSGFTVTTYPQVRDAAPEGWVAHDPFTFCTYCPACWSLIYQNTSGEAGS